MRNTRDWADRHAFWDDERFPSSPTHGCAASRSALSRGLQAHIAVIPPLREDLKVAAHRMFHGILDAIRHDLLQSLATIEEALTLGGSPTIMKPSEERLCDGKQINGLISSMARKLADAGRRVAACTWSGSGAGGAARGAARARNATFCSTRRSRWGRSTSRSTATTWGRASAGPSSRGPRFRLTWMAPKWCWWTTSCSRAGRSARR